MSELAFDNSSSTIVGGLNLRSIYIEVSPTYSASPTYNPVLAKAYYRRGVYFHKSQEYQKATEDYENAIRIEPNTSLAKVCADLLVYRSVE